MAAEDTAPDLTAADELRKLIKDTVASSQDKVAEDVKEQLVQQELQDRVGLVVSALVRLDSFESELKKFKPTVASYDDQGNELGTPGYTRENVELLKKQREKIGKLQKAIEKALGDDRDYAGLKKVVGEK